MERVGKKEKEYKVVMDLLAEKIKIKPTYPVLTVYSGNFSRLNTRIFGVMMKKIYQLKKHRYSLN